MRRVVVVCVLMLVCCEVQAQKSQEFFKFAKFKYDNELYQESLDYLDKALSMDSTYINAYYLRAEVNYELKKYYNTILDINSIFKLKPPTTAFTSFYYLTRAKAFLEVSDLNSAKVDLDKSLALSTNNADLYFYRAKLEWMQEDLTKALEDLEIAIKMNSDNPEYYALRSQIKIKHLKPMAGNDAYQSVLSDINVAIALSKDNYTYYLIRSDFLRLMGEEEEAVEDYNTMIELSPDKENAYTERGVIKMNKFQYKSAVEDFTKSIEINPDDARSFRYRGLCNNNMSRFGAAQSDFTKSIEILTKEMERTADKETVQKNLAETYLLRGHCLNLMGNNANACRDFLTAYNLGVKKGLNYYRKYCGIY